MRGTGREGRPSAPACLEEPGCSSGLGRTIAQLSQKKPQGLTGLATGGGPVVQRGGCCTPCLGGRGRHRVVKLEMPPLPLSLGLLCTFP